MKTNFQRQTNQRGMLLIDCVAYMGMFALILGMAFLAFYRASDHSRDLARNAAEIAGALNVGERWREDLRTANAPPRLEQEGEVSVLKLPHSGGEITYAIRNGTVMRRALPNTNWVTQLSLVGASTMRPESRRQVTAWHWDLELVGRQKVTRLHPLFSFEAVYSGDRK